MKRKITEKNLEDFARKKKRLALDEIARENIGGFHDYFGRIYQSFTRELPYSCEGREDAQEKLKEYRTKMEEDYEIAKDGGTHPIYAACLGNLLGTPQNEVKEFAQKAYESASDVVMAYITKRFFPERLDDELERAYDSLISAGNFYDACLLARDFNLNETKLKDAAKKNLEKKSEDGEFVGVRDIFFGLEAGLDLAQYKTAVEKAIGVELSTAERLEASDSGYDRSLARNHHSNVVWMGLTADLDRDKYLELAKRTYGDKLEEERRLIGFLEDSNSLDKVPVNTLENIFGSENVEWGVRELSHILSLPHHLRKMREDGLTHVVFSATSSVPYVFALKELDKLMFPGQERIKFLMYDTHNDNGRKNFRGFLSDNPASETSDIKRLEDYFKKQAEVRIGVFDECASSFGGRFNKRNTVSNIQNKLTTILPEESIVGRYGTESSYPGINKDNQLAMYHTEHGDEGKGDIMTGEKNIFFREEGIVRWVIGSGNPVVSSKVNDGAFQKGAKSFEGDECEMVPFRGDVWRYRGKKGLRKIEAYKRMARVAHENYLSNPNGVWNPDINKARENL